MCKIVIIFLLSFIREHAIVIKGQPYAGNCVIFYEGRLEITKIQLTTNDNDMEALKFLSVDRNNPYYSGRTRIYGSLYIVGGSETSLKNISLQIIQNGRPVAVAKLADSARTTLINVYFKPTSSGTGRLDFKNGLLFELTNAEAALIDVSKDGVAVLRVHIEANMAHDGEAFADYSIPVKLLTLFSGNNRYGIRDSGLGGDDWVLPSVWDVINRLGPMYRWNDFSKMNGGKFPPHKTHADGQDADGYFDDYNKRDGTVARRLVDMINQSPDLSKIRKIFVTYERNQIDSFWQMIRTVTLRDGRQAPDVIQNIPGHETHFHIVIEPEASLLVVN